MYKERITTCSERLKEGLRARGMKQSDLCKATKIPKSAMSQYLGGIYEPKQDRIYLISQALNVSEAWLMGYDVSMDRKKPSSDKNEITEGEQMLLDLFRQVPEDQQRLVLQMIRAALGNQE